MRIELLELLANYPIVHPTLVERVVVHGKLMEIVVSGHPWWLGAFKGHTPNQITLVFDTISEGALAVPIDEPDDDESLEDFGVQSLADVSWAQPAQNDIYCHAPLPDASHLYSVLQSYLADAHSFKQVGDFLNNGHLLGAFTRLTRNKSYLLARAPDVLRDLFCMELDRQHVPYNIIEQNCQPETRLRVWFNGQSFLCQKAWAEI